MKGRGEDAMAAWLQSRVQAAMQESTVHLRLHPQRSAQANQSPDFVIEVEVRVPLFAGRPLVVKVPILVEVEAGAGFEGALQDLERFVARSGDGSGRQQPVIVLPFIAATEADAQNRLEVVRPLPVCFTAVEVPLPE